MKNLGSALSVPSGKRSKSAKRQAPSTTFQAPKESSIKRQASSPKHSGLSVKPQASSSKICDPGYMWISLEDLGPMASAMIKVLCGCLTWKLNWCGENLILFPLQTFNSIVKKWPWLLLASISGVPSKLLFSNLISEISVKFFLTFAYNFCSGFKGSLVVPLKLFR